MHLSLCCYLHELHSSLFIFSHRPHQFLAQKVLCMCLVKIGAKFGTGSKAATAGSDLSPVCPTLQGARASDKNIGDPPSLLLPSISYSSTWIHSALDPWGCSLGIVNDMALIRSLLEVLPFGTNSI